jgi:hypothetical protein
MENKAIFVGAFGTLGIAFMVIFATQSKKDNRS